MNLPLIIIVGILAVGLVVFLVYKNIKDEAKFEEDVKNIHPVHPVYKDKKDDIVVDELEEGVH
ncbi:MAG: FeoB-associated Cys-rich membrane protein [Bacteroidetes bacterium]|jgi:flagellar basal body-associated protein FliL|nr:FeoB-associated Cys-rich membrane protein [Bacteroidota bacterium]